VAAVVIAATTVIDPLSASPRYLLFHFTTQSF